MNKAIFIGELSLNISLKLGGGADTSVGDRGVASALLCGQMDVETLFVGEAGADAVGDHMVDTLSRANVGTANVDRFTEGVSPVRVESSPDKKPVLHSQFPAEPVNPVWPRINEGDVVVFGSFMALEERNHERIMELVKHARARKAHVVYMPYFEAGRVPRITRVMPEIFDNLEAATLVLATAADLAAIFPGEEPEKAFKDHILFYCKRCMVIEHEKMQLRFFDGDESWTLKCHPSDNTEADWVAGAVAGTVRALAEGTNDPDEIMAKANETAHSSLASKLQ